MFSRLQYITDSPRLAEKACKAGVKWIQARIKNNDEKTWTEIAMDISKICKVHNAICVINDSPEIALRVNADGVHLGKKDMPVSETRKILKNHKLIIGGSANTFEDVIQLVLHKVDYMGLGPLRYTPTKEDLNPVIGADGYELIMEEVERSALTVPHVYAIGGINLNDVKNLLEMGIYGIAVSSSISRAENINHAVQEFLSVLGEKELTYEIKG